MTVFAFICPPFFSHVRAFEAVAESLADRGHRVFFLLNRGGGRLVTSGSAEVLETKDDAFEDEMGATGLVGVLRTVRAASERTNRLCLEGPDLLRQVGAEAILGDQTEPAAGLLARRLGLPFLSLAAAVPIDSEPSLPPPYLGWPYDPSPEGLKRNRGGKRVARLLLRRQRQVIGEWALRFGLPPMECMEDCLSPLGSIAQIIPGFDYPRRDPTRLLPVGPLRRSADDDEAALPFEVDPQRPLVFASFGTLQGHRLDAFQAIAKACRALGLQLAVAHCGGLSEAAVNSIDADHVTDFLPQRAVLRRATACVTHGGLNTVLDALSFGVPMLAVPIAYDQPGVASRLVHHGAGLCLSRHLVTPGRVEAALRQLVSQPRFRQKAALIGQELLVAGGRERAADLVERLLSSNWRTEPEAIPA